MAIANKNFALGFGVFLLVLAVSAAAYFYVAYSRAQQELSSKSNTPEQTQRLIQQVGKIFDLPANETPTIATVSDKDKLKMQGSFFAKAQNQDIVLLYTQARKAILYRPSTNKVIDVAPLNITTISPTPQISQSASIRIALYNGTTTVGLTKKVEQQVVTTDKAYQVVIKDNANKSTYEKTIVVDLTGSNKETAGNLAALLKGNVDTLPAGEVKPNADIAVIIGTSYLK